MNKINGISQDKMVRLALLALAVLAMPAVAHAQSGCTDSPENPTVVLAIVGCAGAFYSTARARLKARRK
jgi:XrtJ-associated TM-motif-TM protein